MPDRSLSVPDEVDSLRRNTTIAIAKITPVFVCICTILFKQDNKSANMVD